MVLTESTMLELGSVAQNFSLLGIDDKYHALKDFDNYSVLVMIFMCNHCPYVQKVLPELLKLIQDSDSQVAFVGVNANANPSYPEDSFEKMKDYATKIGYNFPYLYDEFQSVSKAYGAVCTPDIFVYGKDRTLKYRGHFDGLKQAILDILNGQNPEAKQKPSMGCSIKWMA